MTLARLPHRSLSVSESLKIIINYINRLVLWEIRQNLMTTTPLHLSLERATNRAHLHVHGADMHVYVLRNLVSPT